MASLIDLEAQFEQRLDAFGVSAGIKRKLAAASIKSFAILAYAHGQPRCRRLPDTQFDSLLATATEKVEQAFLALLTGFLQRTLSMQDLTPGEMQCWIQSELVLSPLVATCTQYSVDFCLAWALIGEWTSRILFPQRALATPWACWSLVGRIPG